MPNFSSFAPSVWPGLWVWFENWPHILYLEETCSLLQLFLTLASNFAMVWNFRLECSKESEKNNGPQRNGNLNFIQFLFWLNGNFLKIVAIVWFRLVGWEVNSCNHFKHCFWRNNSSHIKSNTNWTENTIKFITNGWFCMVGLLGWKIDAATLNSYFLFRGLQATSSQI